MNIIVYTCNIFFFFQWNYSMISTTCNDVINVKSYWWCCFWILIICFLVKNIYTWKVFTATKYKFPVWKWMIRLRIFAHCSLFHIRLFGINMTPMWHHYIFICFINVMWLFTRPSDLSIFDFIFHFFKYLSRQDSNDECIILAEMQHSQPHMTFYCVEFVLNWDGNSERNVESLIIILSYSSLASLRPPSLGSLTGLFWSYLMNTWSNNFGTSWGSIWSSNITLRQ